MLTTITKIVTWIDAFCLRNHTNKHHGTYSFNFVNSYRIQKKLCTYSSYLIRHGDFLCERYSSHSERALWQVCEGHIFQYLLLYISTRINLLTLDFLLSITLSKLPVILLTNRNASTSHVYAISDLSIYFWITVSLRKYSFFTDCFHNDTRIPFYAAIKQMAQAQWLLNLYVYKYNVWILNRHKCFLTEKKKEKRKHQLQLQKHTIFQFYVYKLHE